MAVPWNSYPLPTTYDEDDRVTYEAVGRVISSWESVEFELARLYSGFVGDPDGDALQAYGLPRIFHDRLEHLKKAAAAHFVQRPNQYHEGASQHIQVKAEGFSFRRNEVAHGIVMPVSSLSFISQRATNQTAPFFAVLPPYYTIRRHTEGMPRYAYTRVELNDLSRKLISLVEEIQALRICLFR